MPRRLVPRNGYRLHSVNTPPLFLHPRPMENSAIGPRGLKVSYRRILTDSVPGLVVSGLFLVDVPFRQWFFTSLNVSDPMGGASLKDVPPSAVAILVAISPAIGITINMASWFALSWIINRIRTALPWSWIGRQTDMAYGVLDYEPVKALEKNKKAFIGFVHGIERRLTQIMPGTAGTTEVELGMAVSIMSRAFALLSVALIVRQIGLDQGCKSVVGAIALTIALTTLSAPSAFFPALVVLKQASVFVPKFSKLKSIKKADKAVADFCCKRISPPRPSAKRKA